MSVRRTLAVDGNEAAASVAYRVSEVAAIYPITPSSPMGELADSWSSRQVPNIWGRPVTVAEMQAEGGAAGAVHGALQAGSLATTFTASQGLLLMIPNMYKIAGELLPFVMHVAARSVATHALSIFGDHSDVMACRQTGFALLASSSPQEAHDLACVAHAATLRSRIPFLHFFDGFRTSHELQRITLLEDDDLRALTPMDAIAALRERALTPDRPVVRGTAQNPDAFMQAREACNPFYDACADIVAEEMERFGRQVGRHYRPFDYFGHPEAERVVVLMGSGVQTAMETVEHLAARGEKIGAIAVRLYRPFDGARFLETLPKSARRLAVLDRTKEPGANDPLFLDVAGLLYDAAQDGAFPQGPPLVCSGRYGLSSKEFTPSMLKGVFEEIAREKPRRRFTVGITDDVTHLSLPWDKSWGVPRDRVTQALFYGLGADGTVGANKNSIKIISEATEWHVQGYFVYDSKKSGAMTVSHLRFGPDPIRATYLISRASFIACHQFQFWDKVDVLERAAPGAKILLNAPYAAHEVFDRLPREAQERVLELGLELHTIDADAVAQECGLGSRINTIMQVGFFALSGIMPVEQAIAAIKDAIKKTYSKKGDEVVRRNFAGVDAAIANLHKVPLPGQPTTERRRPPIIQDESAPDFVKKVTAVMMEGKGDLLPVSAFTPDGTWPVNTARYEKRNVAREIPVWDPAICIQCNKCAMVCPHAAIRAKAYDPAALQGAPEGFRSIAYKGKDREGMAFTIQTAPEDCTGCHLCVEVCPAKDKAAPKRKAINMEPQPPIKEAEVAYWNHFLALPEIDRESLSRNDVKNVQFLQPLFEFSGACAGCGETPYVKLLTQMYGDRLLMANATGCSSIYGGNLPTTPYATDGHGRGPAWANSLFEDNAEFGYGFRLAVDAVQDRARFLVHELAGGLPEELVKGLLEGEQHGEANVRMMRERVAALREKLQGHADARAQELAQLADYLVRKSIWLVGGDGWAYDIGYGGLDHVLAQGKDVNILVLDTEVYSNTGGQASKATPIGAAAKFAESGKAIGKKDMGLMAMNYGHVYVASIAFGAKDQQTVKVFEEADSYEGPSLIIAYSPCIAHGYDLRFGNDQQKAAVDSGQWPLYRFDPRRLERGEAPLELDAKPGRTKVASYMSNETRFRMVEKINPEGFRRFAEAAQLMAERRIAMYQHLAQLKLPASRRNGNEA